MRKAPDLFGDLRRVNRERTKAPFCLREVSHRKRDMYVEGTIRTRHFPEGAG